MHIYDFIQGLIIGSTLIIAIGPQNLYVINQGLKKTFVFTVVLFCSLSDSILIIIGINISSLIVVINPNTIIILKILGGIWLIFYGLNKIRYVNKIRNLQNINVIESDFKKTLITLFLNFNTKCNFWVFVCPVFFFKFVIKISPTYTC